MIYSIGMCSIEKATDPADQMLPFWKLLMAVDACKQKQVTVLAIMCVFDGYGVVLLSAERQCCCGHDACWQAFLAKPRHVMPIT